MSTEKAPFRLLYNNDTTNIEPANPMSAPGHVGKNRRNTRMMVSVASEIANVVRSIWSRLPRN